MDSSSEINGPGLEGLVAQHLRAWIDYQGLPNKLYYWRTQHGLEIDFIVYGKQFYAIEVKYADKIFARDLAALKAFSSDYPEAKPMLLYRGQERLLKDGIICLPIEDFLKKLNPTEIIL